MCVCNKHKINTVPETHFSILHFCKPRICSNVYVSHVSETATLKARSDVGALVWLVDSAPVYNVATRSY